jgi:hypothetical protein
MPITKADTPMNTTMQTMRGDIDSLAKPQALSWSASSGTANRLDAVSRGA